MLTFTCGTVQVPLEEGRPEAGQLTVQLIRATTVPHPAKRRPSVLLVPGGPGQSGVDNHAFLVGRMSDRLLSTFDVVGSTHAASTTPVRSAVSTRSIPRGCPTW